MSSWRTLVPASRWVPVLWSLALFFVLSGALGVFHRDMPLYYNDELNDGLARFSHYLTADSNPPADDQAILARGGRSTSFRARFPKRPGTTISVWLHTNRAPGISNEIIFRNPRDPEGPSVVRRNFFDRRTKPFVLGELREARVVEMEFRGVSTHFETAAVLDRITIETAGMGRVFLRYLLVSGLLFVMGVLPCWFVLRDALAAALHAASVFGLQALLDLAGLPEGVVVGVGLGSGIALMVLFSRRKSARQGGAREAYAT